MHVTCISTITFNALNFAPDMTTPETYFTLLTPQMRTAPVNEYPRNDGPPKMEQTTETGHTSSWS
jgi:hypothetical protein